MAEVLSQPREYQVVAVDDGTSNERAGEVLKAPDGLDSEGLQRWSNLMERMEKLGYVQCLTS